MPPLQKAQQGLTLLKEAIVEYVSQHPDGATNAQIKRDLGIQSSFEGGHRDWLSWSVVGLLLAERRLHYKGTRRSRRYFVRGA